MVIYRLPRKAVRRQSSDRRARPAGRPLRWHDNIPILSYITLGARCRNCRTRISVRYPLVEIATAAVFIGHYVVFGWTPLLAVRLTFAAAMIALFVIDLEHHLLPDAITLPGIVFGLVASLFLPPGFVALADRLSSPAAAFCGSSGRRITGTLARRGWVAETSRCWR